MHPRLPKNFIHGRFEEILGSPQAGPADNVKRIIFCSGKVYYDLLNYRNDRKIDNAAIIRIEQLYPLAEKKLREMLKPFPKNREVRLVSGRIGKHGRLDFHRTAIACAFLQRNRVRRTRSQRQPRGRRTRPPQARASASGCRRLFDVTLTVVAIASWRLRCFAG